MPASRNLDAVYSPSAGSNSGSSRSLDSMRTSLGDSAETRAVVARDLVQEVVDGADRLDTGEPAARDGDREQCPPARRILLDLRSLQQPDQPVAQHQRIMDRLHAMDVRAQAGREARLRARRNQQVIEGDRARAAIGAIGHGDGPSREVHRRGVRLEELDAAQGLAYRHDDRAGIQASRRDLVQHRREEKEVLRVDEQHFHARIARHRPLELERGVEARETGPKDHDALAGPAHWCTLGKGEGPFVALPVPQAGMSPCGPPGVLMRGTTFPSRSSRFACFMSNSFDEV